MKITIVGCGISGITAAVLLKRKGHQVEMFDVRDHIGGNCYDRKEHGVTLHQYGPHLFHTSDRSVWEFLSEFTEFTGYRHKVVADTALGRIPIPYSLKTEEKIGRTLSDTEIRDLIFVEYSAKQWGVPWSELPDTIRNRVPHRRDNHDNGYFTDEFQGQPKDGFTAMFERMLEGIAVHVGVGQDAWKAHPGDLTIYCGKIDQLYGYQYGALPYRSLRFEHSHQAERLPHAVINQCNALPFTRTYDHAWWLGENPEQTIVTKEFPIAHDGKNVPYYPLPFGEGQKRYSKYKALAKVDKSFIMLGRLATYAYLDMWMAIAQAMVKTRSIA